jgi:hypothetical protein
VDVVFVFDVELFDGRISDLILLGMSAVEVMEAGPPFELSAESMILDKGRVTDDTTVCIDETSREPFCGSRSSRSPRELALMVFSLTGTRSTAMWG